MEGCVYLLDNGDIAKVTARRSEPEFAAYLKTLKKPSEHMPKIKGVWKLPFECTKVVPPDAEIGEWADIIAGEWDKQEYTRDDTDRPVFYLVVREDLASAPNLKMLDNTLFMDLAIALRDYLLKGNPNNALDKKMFKLDIEKAAAKAKSLFGDSLFGDDDAIDQMVEMYQWLGDKKLYLGDLHSANLGYRGNTIVARDLGFSLTGDEDGEKIRVLEPVE
jgi:hypothetical protein